MYNTASVFDALEVDTTNRRTASRQALALAHKRVESHLGNFFRGAQSEEEFMARLSLVSDDFETYVHTASQEVGHDHPEHIAEALKDMYLQAAVPPQFVDPETENNEDADTEDDEASEKSASFLAGSWTVVAGEATEHYEELRRKYEESGHSADHARDEAGRQVKKEHEDQKREEDGTFSSVEADKKHWIQDAVKKPGQLHKDLGVPEGEKIPEEKLEEAEHSDSKKVRERAQFAENVKKGNNPAEQPEERTREQGGEDHKVACPECGGRGKTANNENCPKCHGAGKVRNFGDSMVDNVGADVKSSSWTIIAEEGNDGLGGPEPKMNKDKWTRDNPGQPDDKSKYHPTEEKDPTDPIVMTNRDQDGHDLSEIGEKTTEREELPSAEGLDDSGFNTETPGGKGPHTKTFPKGDQTDPVTRDSIS